jgi:hypothetical protein
MTSATYFPDLRLMLPLTLIRRERLLPDDVDGVVEMRVNDRVGLRDIVARGTNPAPYALLDAESYFRLRKPDQLDALMQVSVGEVLEEDDVVAQRGRRRLLSPIHGRVTYVGGGRIIIQAIPTGVELEAGLNGVIVEVRKGRGVVIETVGALLQGAWGNGRRAIGTLHSEPEEGLGGITIDAIDIGFRGSIVVARKAITAETFETIREQQFAGLIAPGMDADLIEQAMQINAAILLTDGFGVQRMSAAAFRFLDELDGKQATLDAALPSVVDSRRPEVIITVPLPNPGYRPPAINLNQPLTIGAAVRVLYGDEGRSDASYTGEVLDLPNMPVLLDNGLRVRCAQVQLNTGEKLVVPLANLEISG